MLKNKKILLVIIGLLIVIAIGIGIAYFLKKQSDPEKIGYTSYVYYSDVNECLFTEAGIDNDYIMIEDYSTYQDYLQILNNHDNSVLKDLSTKKYNSTYFKNQKLVLIDLYSSGSCIVNESNYQIKDLNINNSVLEAEIDYDLSGGCAGGAGVATFIEVNKDIKDIKITYNNLYNNSTNVVFKPVLYLYPEKETEVSITFEHPDYLIISYPEYQSNWHITANPNGDLYDDHGNYYYALYWEEENQNKVNFEEGFYVEKENAIEFLEEKLTKIGLNAKERNEFIMYWLPILNQNEKNLVYFELTEEKENYNKLIINPAPDSLLRLTMHVKKVNEKTNIKEQILPTFNRIGFSAVEWGGVIY